MLFVIRNRDTLGLIHSIAKQYSLQSNPNWFFTNSLTRACHNKYKKSTCYWIGNPLQRSFPMTPPMYANDILPWFTIQHPNVKSVFSPLHVMDMNSLFLPTLHDSYLHHISTGSSPSPRRIPIQIVILIFNVRLAHLNVRDN